MAKILIVDDAAFMRKVIRDTLTKNGFTDLHEAVDGCWRRCWISAGICLR